MQLLLVKLVRFHGIVLHADDTIVLDRPGGICIAFSEVMISVPHGELPVCPAAHAPARIRVLAAGAIAPIPIHGSERNLACLVVVDEVLVRPDRHDTRG